MSTEYDKKKSTLKNNFQKRHMMFLFNFQTFLVKLWVARDAGKTIEKS